MPQRDRQRLFLHEALAGLNAVCDVLQALDLASFVKTTGGKGLHVVVPLVPHADWTGCLAFSRALSEALERARRGAPVSVPLRWEELKTSLRPSSRSLSRRLAAGWAA